MKLKAIILLLVIHHFTFAQSNATAQIEAAEKAYTAGQFEEAYKIYGQLSKNDRSAEVSLRMAHITVLSNRFEEAENLLTTMLEDQPNDSAAAKLLAEVLYRQDQYDRVPGLLRTANATEKARQMEYFTENQRQPYHIGKSLKKVAIKMETVDFLPSVKMNVNGKEGLFIIDTGGGETIIDSDFASNARAISFGQKEAIYAGGAKAKTTFGFVEELGLGKLKIENVPVHIQPTQQYAQAVGGKRVDGIIGTNLLYHFVSTIDYKNGELILRPKGTAIKDKQATAIPMWLASDHLILANGSIKGGEEQLFLVDTGMAGAGFTAPKSTLEAAEIQLPNSGSFEGQGAGGTVSVTPFMIDKLSLGELSNASQVVGLFGPFPPTLEHSMGFRIGGLISHTFFRPYSVTFDFDKMLIYAEK